MQVKQKQIIFSFCKYEDFHLFMDPDPHLGSWIRVRILIHQTVWIWIQTKRMPIKNTALLKYIPLKNACDNPKNAPCQYIFLPKPGLNSGNAELTAECGEYGRHLLAARNSACHVRVKIKEITHPYGQGCGSGSLTGLAPDSIGSVDPDPGGQIGPTKEENFFKVHVLKCWMASFES